MNILPKSGGEQTLIELDPPSIVGHGTVGEHIFSKPLFTFSLSKFYSTLTVKFKIAFYRKVDDVTQKMQNQHALYHVYVYVITTC